MGGCGSKPAENEVSVPLSHREHMINQQYSQFMQLHHPLNVNHKYNSQFTVIPNQFVGEGIRKSNAYTTKLCRSEWEKMKEDFWETRIEGRKECWQAVKLACESDEQTAIAILNAAELKLVNRSIQILFDAQGHKYDIPVFCLHEPVEFSDKPSYEHGLVSNFQNETYLLKIRSAKFEDFSVDVNTDMQVLELKGVIISQKKVEKVRLFVGGREMQDHHSLGNYKLGADSVQAYCRPFVVDKFEFSYKINA